MARNSPDSVDAVIVLGGRVEAGDRPSGRLQARMTAGIDAFRIYRARFLLVTGGASHRQRAEALVLGDLAVSAGVERDRILIEPAARTTFENAALSIELLRRHGLSRVVLVTDHLHLPRAALAFRALGLNIQPHPAPWKPKAWTSVAWLHAAFYEATVLLWYVLQIAAGRHRRVIAPVGGVRIPDS